MSRVRPPISVSRRERRIMDILYRRGRTMAGEVLADSPVTPATPPYARSCASSRTGGHVHHEEVGLRYVYVAAVPCEAARKSALR
jgi:BlaI family penicillinase repressor